MYHVFKNMGETRSSSENLGFLMTSREAPIKKDMDVYVSRVHVEIKIKVHIQTVIGQTTVEIFRWVLV